MRGALIVFASLVAMPAFAQKPVGCDKFKWPIDRERALLADAKPVSIGADVADGAVSLNLSLITEVKLPMDPSRQPKPNTYVGFVRYAPPPRAGRYRVTLSEPGWIDVIQDGQEIEAGPASGVTGCDGIRKSVIFYLGPSPFVVEITGSPVKTIAIAVTSDRVQ
jgi:hypothetical protein